MTRRVSARDSGKPMVDAIVGEVVVTCEKIHWLCNEGEGHLKPEKRSAGIMVRERESQTTGSERTLTRSSSKHRIQSQTGSMRNRHRQAR